MDSLMQVLNALTCGLAGASIGMTINKYVGGTMFLGSLYGAAWASMLHIIITRI